MPNFSAKARFLGLISTPIILFAPTIRAPWMTFKPIPPKPKTTTFAPGSTLAV